MLLVRVNVQESASPDVWKCHFGFGSKNEKNPTFFARYKVDGQNPASVEVDRFDSLSELFTGFFIQIPGGDRWISGCHQQYVFYSNRSELTTFLGEVLTFHCPRGRNPTLLGTLNSRHSWPRNPKWAKTKKPVCLVRCIQGMKYYPVMCGDYDKPWGKDPFSPFRYFMESEAGVFFFVARVNLNQRNDHIGFRPSTHRG